MNNNHIKKIAYEVGKLPSIISDIHVFGRMDKKERKAFYTIVERKLKEVSEETNEDYNRSRTHLKNMCNYPNERLNKAFLENKGANEKHWHVFVGAIASSLEDHLLTSLDKYQEDYRFILLDMKHAEKRINEMQSDIEKYILKSA